jgi:hypothetical protein
VCGCPFFTVDEYPTSEVGSYFEEGVVVAVIPVVFVCCCVNDRLGFEKPEQLVIESVEVITVVFGPVLSLHSGNVVR